MDMDLDLDGHHSFICHTMAMDIKWNIHMEIKNIRQTNTRFYHTDTNRHPKLGQVLSVVFSNMTIIIIIIIIITT